MYINESKKMILVTAAILSVTIYLGLHVQTDALGSTNSTMSPQFSYSNSTSGNSTGSSGNSTLSTTPDPCIRSAEIQIHSITSSFDIVKATSLYYNNNPEFKSKIQGYASTYVGTFDTWHIDKTSCTVTWKTANMVYDLRNSTGNIIKSIIVTEDPALIRVLNITEQSRTPSFSRVVDQSIWSGYEFAGDGNNPPTTQMQESYSTFSVPVITNPNYPTNACVDNVPFSTKCSVAAWVGLENQTGAVNSALVQTGFDANMTCTSSNSCIVLNSLWWQIGANSNPHYCTGQGADKVNPTDSITADVFADTLVGGTDPNLYDLLVYDNTNPNAACSVQTPTDYFTPGVPIYSSFIVETPEKLTVPQFTNIRMTDNFVTANNNEQYISNLYSNGWFNEYNMFNSFETNINNGDVVGNSFTETWSTNCLLPAHGTWTVSSTCTVTNFNYNLPGSVLVQSGAVLRIPFGIKLGIDFLHNNLQVNHGGGVLIDGGDTKSTGGKITCPTSC